MIPFQLIEKVFAVFVLFFYTGGVVPFIGRGHPLEPLTIVLPHVAAAVALVLLIFQWQKSLTMVVRSPLLWLMVSMVAISPFWSDRPHETWAQVMPMLRVTLFSLYLASRYSFKEILQLLGWAMGMAAGLSFVAGALFPSYGVMGQGYIGQSQDWTHEGSWRGIYIHKTMLGTFMAFAILVCSYLASWKNPLRPLAIGGMAIAALTLMMSTTKAALATLFVVFLCIPIYRSVRWKLTRLTLFWSICLPILITAVAGTLANAAPILSAFGKNTTLSGRTVFWPLIIDSINQKPWLGYGFHTFWLNGWEGTAANVWVYLPRGFEPPHAHNGYLEVLLSLGMIGFGLFLLTLATYSWRALRWARAHPTAEGLVPLLFLTFMMLVNITESLWLTSDLLWVCYCTLFLVTAQKQPQQDYWEIYPVIEKDAYAQGKTLSPVFR